VRLEILDTSAVAMLYWPYITAFLRERVKPAFLLMETNVLRPGIGRGSNL